MTDIINIASVTEMFTTSKLLIELNVPAQHAFGTTSVSHVWTPDTILVTHPDWTDNDIRQLVATKTNYDLTLVQLVSSREQITNISNRQFPLFPNTTVAEDAPFCTAEIQSYTIDYLPNRIMCTCILRRDLEEKNSILQIVLNSSEYLSTPNWTNDDLLTAVSTQTGIDLDKLSIAAHTNVR